MGWLVAFLILFIWHEFEEYRVLLPWLCRNRKILPVPLQGISLSPPQFTLIATEEFALVVAVALVLEPIWLKAAIVAYAAHLVIHCGQIVFTWMRGAILRLWSAPIQLPLISSLLMLMPIGAQGELLWPSSVMIVVMILNLVLMHVLVQKISGQR